MSNKKILNAEPLVWGGIKFRSKLEVLIFRTLQEAGVNPEYEPKKFTIWKGYKPKLPFFIRDKKTRALINDNHKVIDIHYTPDIMFFWHNNVVLVEVKPQFCNDVYPYKRKLFRKYLEDIYENGETAYYPIFAQIGTKKETLELLDILNREYT